MNDELLIALGGSIKAMPSGKLTGKAVVFSGPHDPDRVGDFFSANTFFDLEQGTKRVGLYLDHARRNVKGELARAVLTMSDDGLMAESQLDMKNATQRALWEQAQRGELNFSSGSAGHLVQRVPVTPKVSWVARWPVVEVSILPRGEAAEPRAIVSVKSFLGFDDHDMPPEVQQALWSARARELWLQTMMMRLNDLR